MTATPKSPGLNPRWARSPWTTNCSTPRSRRWRANALWPTGGRDDEPNTLALVCSLLWSDASCARVEGRAHQRLSLPQRDAANTIARRPGPVGACSDSELADHIRQQIAASRLHGEGYRKIWARLRFAGVRASPRRVRRVMGENGLLAPHRVGRAESKPHDGTIVTNKVNEMWGTDMTQTITVAEGRAYVFVAVEHANSEVVGIHAARSANRFEALEPVRQGVHRCFGSIAPGVARGLMLRHDHGFMSGSGGGAIDCTAANRRNETPAEQPAL